MDSMDLCSFHDPQFCFVYEFNARSSTVDGINFAYKFVTFRKAFRHFFKVFARFLKFSEVLDPYRPVQTCWDTFGYVRMCLEVANSFV